MAEANNINSPTIELRSTERPAVDAWEPETSGRKITKKDGILISILPICPPMEEQTLNKFKVTTLLPSLAWSKPNVSKATLANERAKW